MRIQDPTTLPEVPLDALDADWERGLRQAGEALHRRWLRAADALRDGVTEGRSRARCVYWALRDALDPASEDDVPRILHVLRSGLERGPAFAALAERAASSSDERLRLAAALCVAQCRSVASEFEDAERRIRAVLAQVRGTGTRLERTAYASLAVVYQNQGREFEALVLTRIVLRLSAGAADPWEACVAHQQHCALLDALGDWEHMDRALDELADALEEANPPWAWTVWRYIHGERAEAALQRGDLDEARLSARRMDAVVPPGTAEPSVPLWHPLLLARLALAEGRPAEALEALSDEALRGDADALIVAVRACFAVGERQLALEHGRACLDLLEAEREVWGGAAQRLRSAAGIAAVFEDDGAEPADVRRAYDVAAEAAMRRILELERTIAGLPDLGEMDPADHRTLEAFRLRFRERHARLLDRLAGYLVEELERGPLSVNEGHVRVCAWCHRIASRADQWLPVGHLLPSRAGVPLTHTICPECVHTHGFR